MRRHARELDPLAVSGAGLAWDLLFARHYDQAVQELHSVLALSADNANALWILGFVLIANHHPKDAIRELEKGVSISNRSPALMGLLINAYAQADRRRDALRLLEELKRRKQTAYVPAAAFIFAYLGLGENDQAFVWLEQAYKEQSNVLQTLKVLPLFDPIRSDPRFVDLLHRVGLDRPSLAKLGNRSFSTARRFATVDQISSFRRVNRGHLDDVARTSFAEVSEHRIFLRILSVRRKTTKRTSRSNCGPSQFWRMTGVNESCDSAPA
jgi:tetratricopeptide (TPR) repeat protein